MGNQPYGNERLCYTTTRIECQSAHGSGRGTSFFFDFCIQSDGTRIPCLVTNKHVVDGCVAFTIWLTRKDSDGNPIHGEAAKLRVTRGAEHWIYHPDPQMDLCVLPMVPILEAAKKQLDIDVFYVPMSRYTVVSQEILEDMLAVEDVLMVGYPIGLADEVNNLPLVRKGITATPLIRDYQGRKEFVIDCACFPGSSGSPIYFYSTGARQSRRGNLVVGTNESLLIGILWGGPQFEAKGSLETISIPTQVTTVPIMSIPMNLGFAIKASVLSDFEPLLAPLAGFVP